VVNLRFLHAFLGFTLRFCILLDLGCFTS
jgi:hypothetical protein